MDHPAIIFLHISLVYLWDRFCSFCYVPGFGAERRVAFRMFIMRQY